MARVGLAVAICMIAITISAVAADDREEILAGLQRHFDALKGRDIEAHLKHHLPTKSTFPGDGGLLRTFTSMDEQRRYYEGLDDLGVVDQELRDTEVKIFGDTAIVTGYVIVTEPTEDGSKRRTTFRRTAVLVKQNDQWKEAHLHISECADEPGP